MSELRLEFTRGAAVAFGLHAAAMTAAFGAQLAYARGMDQAAFGVFAQALAAATVAANLVVAGAPRTMLQLLPAYATASDWAGINGLIAWSRRRVLGVAAVTAVAWSAIAIGIGAAPAWILAGPALVPVAAVISQQSQALAWRDIWLAQLPGDVVRPLLALALFGAALSLPIDRPTLAMLGVGVAALAVAAVTAPRLRARLPEPAIGVAAIERPVEWRPRARQFFGSGVFSWVLERADLLIVGWYLGPEPAAVFAIVVGLAKLLLFALTAVNAITAPTVAAYHAQGRRDDVQSVLRLGAAAATALAVAAALPMALVADPLLALFGDGYRVGAHALWLCLAGYLVNAGSGSSGLMVGQAGHQHVNVRVIGAAAAFMVLANAVAVPRWGIEGAAAVRSLAMIGWNVGLATYARRVIGYETTILAVFRRPSGA